MNGRGLDTTLPQGHRAPHDKNTDSQRDAPSSALRAHETCPHQQKPLPTPCLTVYKVLLYQIHLFFSKKYTTLCYNLPPHLTRD